MGKLSSSKADCDLCLLITRLYPEGRAETPRAERIIAQHFLRSHLVPIRPYLVKA